MAKKGDKVRFLNDVGGGIITRIDGNIAYVSDEDGFETPTLLRECVVVETAESAAKNMTDKSKPAPANSVVAAPAPRVEKVASAATPASMPVEETAEGDTLNVVLAFEPADVRRLSDTTYYCSLVNDSNYYLSFSLLSRENADASASAPEANWHLVAQGTVEPNIELLVDEFATDDVARFDRIAFQFTAYKRDKLFTLQAPVDVRISVDTTKFFKLHCFKDNPYFEHPVLAFDIVRDGVPYGAKPAVDAREVAKSLNAKLSADRQPRRRPVVKRQSRRDAILEVDLHASALLDDTRGLSNADILNFQIDKFREVMDANLRNKGQRIVFIHGKGEGVLRQALTKELTHRYKGHDVQDASFAQYGFGATQVTIR